jgi:hypothetical protein
MDTAAFEAWLQEEYPDCDDDTAAEIAERASEYREEVDPDKTTDEWISFMRDAEQDDPEHWDGENPYKVDP